MSPFSTVELGFLVGFIPTMSMIGTSAFMSFVKVSPDIEACFQNFAAGLIIAAVAKELVPLLYTDVTKEDSMGGITIGFFLGLALLNGLEYAMEQFEENEDEDGSKHGDEDDHIPMSSLSKELFAKNRKLYEKQADAAGIEYKKVDKAGKAPRKYSNLSDSTAGSSPDKVDNTDVRMIEMTERSLDASPSSPKKSVGFADTAAAADDTEARNEDVVSVDSDDTAMVIMRKSLGYKNRDVDDFQTEDVEAASKAIDNPSHRAHIFEHIQELFMQVVAIESKCNRLVEFSMSGNSMQTGPTLDGNDNPLTANNDATSIALHRQKHNVLTRKESDALAEEMDEGIHKLEYLLDHCRRLLQGTEFEFNTSDESLPTWAKLVVIDAGNKSQMTSRIKMLRNTAEHLVEHLQGSVPITPSDLKEIFMHMDEMHEHIANFHDSVETVATRWKRSNRKLDKLVDPKIGATLPIGLVVPVTVDCLTDGMLIGIACALNPKAGYVLGFANTLEMGILGLAYSSRLQKCTGSSYMARLIALYAPPVVMTLAAGVGAAMGKAAEDEPLVYVAFVSFGVVALLSLVCGELLIEAKEAQEDGDVWYIGLTFFVGVYIVLMISPLLP